MQSYFLYVICLFYRDSQVIGDIKSQYEIEPYNSIVKITLQNVADFADTVIYSIAVSKGNLCSCLQTAVVEKIKPQSMGKLGMMLFVIGNKRLQKFIAHFFQQLMIIGREQQTVNAERIEGHTWLLL